MTKSYENGKSDLECTRNGIEERAKRALMFFYKSEASLNKAEYSSGHTSSKRMQLQSVLAQRGARKMIK